ncbi:MAG: energy-coupling factor ABC transporter ATP-binding protein [Chloroflexota bacterium]|nr:energy-coupling factor ABC transporter ATP-binding protein [Chloroflexota bacterium]
MLTLEGVTYRYPGARRPSLRDIHLELANGEVVGLVGAGEAGKTTLCLVASGLAPRSVGGTLDGRLLIDGEDTAGRPIHDLAARVGVGFQNPATQLSQVADTVFEEVAFGALNLGLDRLDVAARTAQALHALGIDRLAERDPRRLSGGQMQLVAVAGLLAMRPAHLVLDEPTAQLDPEGKQLVAQALRRLSAEGTALLIAEHDTDLLAALCRRVVALDGGSIVLSGATADVLADRRLPALGIDPPARIRLARALEAAGVSAELPT